MNTDLFIAQKIYFNKDGENRLSSPAIRIAVVSMALGVVIILLAIGIVIGFKQEVRTKVTGFGSHLQITNIRSNTLYENDPLSISPAFIDSLYQYKNVKHIQATITKPGIIKTDNDFQGIILKGVDENFDWDFFKQNLIEGDILKIHPDSSITDVILSKAIADKLHLKVGDSFTCYFIQEPVRVRKFHIQGIYQTYFSEYDQLFILGDSKQLRRLNGWEKDWVSALEVSVYDYDLSEQTKEAMYFDLSTKTDRLDNPYYLRSIRQINPMIFAWLDVLDTNVVVIFILMLLVAGFSMISGLLIIILERTSTIGILKALGQDNNHVRRIFLYISGFLIVKGLLWGNIIALVLYFIQKHFGIFRLDPEIYYVSQVPVELNVWIFLAVNIGTLIITLCMLLLPSYLVAKISPATTIRFE